MATSPLPRTSAGAPPNFYSQVGSMGGGQPGQGQPGQQQQPGQPDASSQAAATPDPDREFLEATTKLLTVLGKMGKMQPRGMDVSKFTDAAAQSIKDCVTHVFTKDKGKQTPGTSAGAAANANPPGTPESSATDTSTPGIASASNATGAA